ncbi:glutamate--tRNA ligase family protein [Shivajiella indica]|uniref:Glutamate--tRNA ligase family protein n=1 Tax=Shivajiella indica TaxID=872115 RepID=A0ABW5B9S4_9BACT
MTPIPKNIPFKLTRFAPTPSGFLHIGNIYSFIITYHLAKKHQSKIMLRIDDMDRERIKNKYIQDIFETLDFLEIPYHQGPKNLQDFQKNFSQVNRLNLYQDALLQLKETGLLFACDCSRKKIEKMDPNGYYTGFCRNRNLDFNKKDLAWRIKVDKHQEVTFIDLKDGLVTGKIPGILSDFIVRKKDTFPAYQLASVVDDLHYGVDLIIRGKDLWGSTLAQTFLSKRLPTNNFAETTFYHHPLIKGPNNQKLSKSAGSTSIQFLRKSGKKKEDVFEVIGNQIGSKNPLRSLEDFSFE